MKILDVFGSLAYAVGSGGECYILTGCRTDQDGGQLYFDHKIKLNGAQAQAVGEIIDEATFAQRRIIAGLADILTPQEERRRAAALYEPAAPEDCCPRCGEHPPAEGDTLCLDCRAWIGESIHGRLEFKPYTNTICPVCGQKLRPAVQCHRAGASICMTHCFNPPCEHLDMTTSLTRCTYAEDRGGQKAQQKTV
ncbi:hypothetical protein [Anaerotruncus sp. AF02-27]|uniref:hypothetical protein n=1 Tax=Anaerotruncus sp. AF02-27 TaxID=2292191 RepID=UPI0011C241E1|nr:hypothetical protein [Anaerotruncus sp. AF02-27]